MPQLSEKCSCIIHCPLNKAHSHFNQNDGGGSFDGDQNNKGPGGANHFGGQCLGGSGNKNDSFNFGP